MNREILFRGKRKDNGEWVEGDLEQDMDLRTCYISGYNYYTDEDGLQREPFLHEVDPETVGQYTGLTDKNGEKIFDGSLIKNHFGGNIGVIKFGKYAQPFNADKSIGFYINWISGISKNTLRRDLGYWIDSGEASIIGNIHDNPELLKGDDI